ncbi:MAG: PilC/PilY family type IV pilus protein, partial [Nitrospirota bacterium]
AYGTFTNVGSVCTTGCWRPVLAGGLGGGGKGIYALDVTDPDGSVTTSGISTALLAFNENNAAKIALWEMPATGANVSNMGYVYGQPTIAKVKTDANSHAWAVIFGNGYNSANENAVLYIANAVTGVMLKEIPLVAPGYSATGNSNGLSMPAVVDTNGDYVADRVYAGDLRGNLWKVDISGNNPGNWSASEPLFKATDGTTANTIEQPITVQQEVGAHPDGQSGYMVYFGTGRYIATSDNQANTSPIQTFYGIWDRGDVSQIPRSKLLPQTISTATTVNSITVRQVTNDAINWCTVNNIDSCTCDNTSTGKCLGWRDNLLTATTGSLGEKAVSNPVLVGGTVPRIIFTTLI